MMTTMAIDHDDDGDVDDYIDGDDYINGDDYIDGDVDNCDNHDYGDDDGDDDDDDDDNDDDNVYPKALESHCSLCPYC